jgi:hypothetical protein
VRIDNVISSIDEYYQMMQVSFMSGDVTVILYNLQPVF